MIVLGNTVGVYKEELIPNFIPSYDALKKRLQRHEDKPYGIKRIRKGGNNHELLIDYDTLDENIQLKLGDPRKVKHVLENYFKEDPEALSFYSSFQYPDGSYLTPKSKEKYLINASVMKALMKLEEDRLTERKNKNGTTRGILNTIFNDAHSFQDWLLVNNFPKHSLNTNARRFKQKYSDFKNHGYLSLIKDAQGKSKRNATKVCKKTEKVLHDIFAGQHFKPTATDVARDYCDFIAGNLQIVSTKTGEVYDPKGFKELNQSTITHFLSKWRSKIATHTRRSGDRQNLINKFTPYYSMDKPVFAGSILSIDDRQPPFKYKDADGVHRPWFYVGIDVASEAITVAVWGKSKEGIIEEFYRQMVRNYGAYGVQLPHELECESSLNSNYTDTILRPGAMFQEVRIEANNARGKFIERMFGKLRYEIEKSRRGWIARPFAKSEKNQAGPGEDIILPYEQIIQECLQDIEDWNNSPHSEHKHMSRWDYFMQNQHIDLKPTNYREILPYIGRKTKTSCKVARVALDNSKYLLGDNSEIATGEQLVSIMDRIEGQDLDAYWLDDVEGGVLKSIVTKRDDNRVICELVEDPKGSRSKLEETEQHKINRGLMASYQNTITAYQKLRAGEIDKVEIYGRKPKTISNTFKMPGLKKFVPNETPAEELPIQSNKDLVYVENDNDTDNTPSWKKAFN